MNDNIEGFNILEFINNASQAEIEAFFKNFSKGYAEMEEKGITFGEVMDRCEKESDEKE